MEMPTLKLARIMYSENNMLFKDVEDARTSLRYIEDKTGNKGIKKEQKYIVPERSKNPYGFPPSDERIYEPFKLKASRVLVLSDIHIPYHSLEALTAAFDFSKKEKPDCVV